MVKTIWWVTGILIAAGLTAIYYFRSESGTPATTQSEPSIELPVPQKPPAPAIRHPLPSSATETPDQQPPLPPLGESDKPIQEALAESAAPAPVGSFLIPDNIVRRFVTTVDNLPRQKVAVQLRPVKPTPGLIPVNGDEDKNETLTLSEENYARYTPFVEALKAADAKKFATVYLRFYPLFQQSYEDLGYPGRYFNDRLVEVIDHLLETPDVKQPIELKRPKVFFEFADPNLEASSAGRKLLMRMGPQNAAAIKEKLRELRREIAASPTATN